MTVSAPIRIAFILPSFAGGGAERVLLTLLAGINRDRYDPVLLVMDGRGPLKQLTPSGIMCHDLRTPRLRAAGPALLKQLRRIEPRIVFSSVLYMNLAILALRPFLPRSTALVIREANLPSLSLPEAKLGGALRMAAVGLYRTADCVIASSELMTVELNREFKVPDQCIRQLPNPVDRRAIRTKIVEVRRVPGFGLRFVAAGRMTKQKGFDRLIHIFPQLPNSCHVTIFGEGPERAAVERYAADLGLEPQVSFKEFENPPWAWYAGADAFLLPSRWEGFSNAALEALACGTPVIATPEAGAISELAAVAGGDSVHIAPMGDPFVDTMKNVRPALGSSARPNLLPARYETEKVVSKFELILAELV